MAAATPTPLEQILAIARSARIARQLEENKRELDAMPSEQAALHEDDLADGLVIGPYTVLVDDPEGDLAELRRIIADQDRPMAEGPGTQFGRATARVGAEALIGTPPPTLSLEETVERLRPLLIPGVVITHTRCLGIVEEHTFVRLDRDRTICGHPTRDTALIRGYHLYTDDIHPLNVTHINREPIALWLDPDVGKIPEPVAYQPSPEQIEAERALRIIERNGIRDSDTMVTVREIIGDAGPDLAVQWEESVRQRELRQQAAEDEVPW